MRQRIAHFILIALERLNWSNAHLRMDLDSKKTSIYTILTRKLYGLYVYRYKGRLT